MVAHDMDTPADGSSAEAGNSMDTDCLPNTAVEACQGAAAPPASPTDTPALELRPLQPVQIGFTTLRDQRSCNDAIEQAFGREGLGLIVVHGVPGFAELRQRLLPLASQVQALPADVKQGLESPETQYSYGYSIARESLEDGQPDDKKMSYYANPTVDDAAADSDTRRRHPGCTGRNIWPTESLPQLQPAFEDLGRLMVRIGLLLAAHLDGYVEAKGLRPRRRLADIIQHSPCHKGRLLHYLPSQPGQAGKQRWCGMHTDHGSLTGLVSAMFLRDCTQVSCPDPQAGLWVSNRKGSFQKVLIPPDALAFQLGEASQVLSGGLLQATPHYVQGAQGAASHGIARNTFAVFMQPRWDEEMDVPAGADICEVGIGQCSPGISFGDFSERTIQKYHPAQPSAKHVAEIV